MPTTPRLSSGQVEPLLKVLGQWENCTVVLIHQDSVFEFKGPFPKGYSGSGYYNLRSGGQGFEGHLKIDHITSVSFQDSPHRGKESYAFVFENAANEPVFKVFVGRKHDYSLIPEQVNDFKRIQQSLNASAA